MSTQRVQVISQGVLGPQGPAGPPGAGTGVGALSGTGSPEGVVVAAVGTEYVDLAATNGAVKWVKASGTGNTGWRVAWGDTGRRNMSALLLNGWTGNVWLSRINDTVIFEAESLTAPDPYQSHPVILLPEGFKPAVVAFPQNRDVLHTTATPVAAYRTNTNSSGFNVVGVAGVAVNGSVRYQTNAPWPATLPGT